MRKYDNYDLLNLAIFKQAQDDYLEYSIKLLKIEDKIRDLECLLPNWKIKDKINDLMSLKLKYTTEKQDILTWWENVHHSFYEGELDYEFILKRFYEMEKDAVKIHAGKMKWQRRVYFL